ncbi:MAG: glycoside hydrolase family 13 protein [Blautia sp.]|nr:glycoside hydrolase family 13 protein [Blautia sp.]
MDFERTIANRKMQYMLNMRPILNRSAIYSDGSEYFRSPVTPKSGDEVHIRIRTARNNIDGAMLVADRERYPMKVVMSRNGFDYYEAVLTIGENPVSYYFEIMFGWNTYYYQAAGFAGERDPRMDFVIYPDFDTPEWFRGKVMYQIFPDRFCNGDPTNDVETGEYAYIEGWSTRVQDWNATPAEVDIREFYGGDLQGIMNKLDYLQELGVEVLYLNPIFVSPSNHKYDCQDYEAVDPHFGKIVADDDRLLQDGDQDNTHAYKYIARVTDPRNLEASNELFVRLVEEIHRRGMKIILDGVFNHCGSFNKWMDRERIYENREGYPAGAYVSAESPYRNYFRFENEYAWPYNATYDGWWGHNTLPKLNYEDSMALYRHVLNIGRKWVSPPYNIDGWRLDVAADLGHSEQFNHKFWKDFRRAVRNANPDTVILAEHYGNPESWLHGDEWDTVMNYDAFMEPLTWFLTGMEKHSDEFREDLFGNSEAFISAMRQNMQTLHMQALYTAMNELSNHDHSRFLTRTNHKVGRVASLGAQAASEEINPAVMREAVAVQMTWPGCPTVYYGDEAGLCGFTDPDNRRTFPWGREDLQMLDFHKAMIRIHKRFGIISSGSLVFLWNDYQGLAYARFSYDEQLIVIINNQDTEREVEIGVWKAGISRNTDALLERIMLSDSRRFTEETAYYTAKGGLASFTMPAFGIMILYHEEN